MIRVLAIILPFPFSVVLTAAQLEKEIKVEVKGFRMTPAELLAFTRGKRVRR